MASQPSEGIVICRLLCKFLDRFAEDPTPEQDACESCGLRALDCSPEIRSACEMRRCALPTTPESPKGAGK